MKLFEVILIVQVLILFEQGSGVRQARDGNLITAENKENFMYLFKSDQSQNYLNYRAVYGLRYSPSKKLSVNTDFVRIHDLEQPFNDSIPSEVNSASEIDTENVNDEVAASSVESETVATPTSSSPHDFTFDAVEPAVDESRNHIMRPNNRVEYALDFLAERLKKLLYYSSDFNRPESKVSPQLTSLGKFLNLFDLIKFENIPCLTAQKPLRQLSGTCYKEVECTNLGGLAVDQCASGFGVCCVCEFCFIDFSSLSFCFKDVAIRQLLIFFSQGRM